MPEPENRGRRDPTGRWGHLAVVRSIEAGPPFHSALAGNWPARMGGKSACREKRSVLWTMRARARVCVWIYVSLPWDLGYRERGNGSQLTRPHGGGGGGGDGSALATRNIRMKSPLPRFNTLRDK